MSVQVEDDEPTEMTARSGVAVSGATRSGSALRSSEMNSDGSYIYKRTDEAPLSTTYTNIAGGD